MKNKELTMKTIGLIVPLLFAGCTHTPKVQNVEVKNTCSEKCKKSYAIGSKYQKIKKQKSCEQRCQNSMES